MAEAAMDMRQGHREIGNSSSGWAHVLTKMSGLSMSRKLP